MSEQLDFTTPAPVAVDFRRDRWGRPLILQLDGTTRTPYNRASGAAKPIEETFNLEKWARRNVAYGLAADPSLVARILAIGGTPHEWDNPAKTKVNEICDAAATVAQAHRGADIGTAIHTLTEQLDRGQPVTAGPYQADLDAYITACQQLGLTMLPEFVEARMVCDSLELAGTCDRIAQLDSNHVIADVKAGATVKYATLGHAAQLAGYANSVLYDPVTEQRLPTPDINRADGYIIHLPAGQGRCDIYRLDLTEGYAAAELANRVRIARKYAKRWITPAVRPVEARRAALRERYRLLTNEDQLAFVKIGADPDDLDAVEAALNTVDPFAQITPTPAPRPATAPVVLPVAAAPEEGPAASSDAVNQLRAAWVVLDEEQAEWVRQQVAAAGNLSVTERPSVRRVTLGFALVQLAAAGWHDNELLAAVVAHSGGEALPEAGHHAALAIAADVDELVNGRLTFAVNNDGAMCLTGTPQATAGATAA